MLVPVNWHKARGSHPLPTHRSTKSVNSEHLNRILHFHGEDALILYPHPSTRDQRLSQKLLTRGTPAYTPSPMPRISTPSNPNPYCAPSHFFATPLRTPETSRDLTGGPCPHNLHSFNPTAIISLLDSNVGTVRAIRVRRGNDWIPYR